MKTYKLSFAQSCDHRPEHPERTARRNAGTGTDFDILYQVWPNRASMLKTVELQSRGVARNPWRPCIPNCSHCMSYPHAAWCNRNYPQCSICRDYHPNDDRHPCE